jgi:acetoin:2,6-dichlorophenolindophenol oxidoreductase subunit beta
MPDVAIDPNATETAAAEATYADAVAAGLREAMREDERVWVLGEDVAEGGAYGATQGLRDEFGAKRVRNTPISETAIVGFSVGAAMTGTRPVPEIMHMDFIACAMDQVVNQLAKVRYMVGGKTTVPVTVRCGVGGWLQAAAQHSQSLEAWFAHIPGLKVAAAAEPADIKGVLLSAIRDDNPTIVMESLALYPSKGHVPDGPVERPVGRAARKREGSDVTIITWGGAVPQVMRSAEQLAARGIHAEVLDLLWLYPFDREALLESVARTHYAVVVHQAYERGGFGAEIAAFLGEHARGDLDAPVRRVGGLDVPVPFAPSLEEYVLPGPERIIRAVESLD